MLTTRSLVLNFGSGYLRNRKKTRKRREETEKEYSYGSFPFSLLIEHRYIDGELQSYHQIEFYLLFIHKVGLGQTTRSYFSLVEKV
jgi:hypothetical protein